MQLTLKGFFWTQQKLEPRPGIMAALNKETLRSRGGSGVSGGHAVPCAVVKHNQANQSVVNCVFCSPMFILNYLDLSRFILMFLDVSMLVHVSLHTAVNSSHG